MILFKIVLVYMLVRMYNELVCNIVRGKQIPILMEKARYDELYKIYINCLEFAFGNPTKDDLNIYAFLGL